jgi:uncharacterized protein
MRPDQRATGRYQIISGDWGHGGGLDQAIMLEWYDTFVKRQNTGIDKIHTPLHLYERGSNRWINAAQYPIVSDYTKLYLGPKGELARQPIRADQTDTLVWEQPDQPGGLLTFETRPFAKGATLAGHVSATVHASSSNTNLELIASLYDVAPNGTATLVTNGAVLGSQRARVRERSWYDEDGTPVLPYLAQKRDDYLIPGHTYRLEIALSPRQRAIVPGNRLRLTLTTQTPTAVCAGGGTDPCVPTAPQAATLPRGVYTIHYGKRTASSLNLPLLPYGFFATATGGVTATSGGANVPLDWSSAEPRN